MECVKKLEKQHGRISRYMGSGMYGKCGSELERPYPSPKGKEKAYKLGEIVCQRWDLLETAFMKKG